MDAEEKAERSAARRLLLLPLAIVAALTATALGAKHAAKERQQRVARLQALPPGVDADAEDATAEDSTNEDSTDDAATNAAAENQIVHLQPLPTSVMPLPRKTPLQPAYATPRPAPPAQTPLEREAHLRVLAAMRPSQRDVGTAWFEGADGFRSGTLEQEYARAPMLLYFYTDWCKACRRFRETVVDSPEMSAVANELVKVRVNAEGSEDDRALAARFGVRAYPTILYLRSAASPPTPLGWSTNAANFVAMLRRQNPR